MQTLSPAPAYRRYVAIGDSFTEGVGDPVADARNGLRGWADVVAAHLAATMPGLRYANFAVRGRRMADIMDDQVPPAVALAPDLVTVNAGLNDLLLRRTDLDAVAARYAVGLRALRDTGARVLTFTAADLGDVPLFRVLRGRAAIYNELLRGICDDVGIELVDFWRFTEFRDPRLWDGDRIHLSALGHEHMAGRVLDTLGVPHGFAGPPPPALGPPPQNRYTATLQWSVRFAAPYVSRRLRRLTPGAGIEPKTRELVDPGVRLPPAPALPSPPTTTTGPG